jgi:hypothetical protein
MTGAWGPRPRHDRRETAAPDAAASRVGMARAIACGPGRGWRQLPE